MLPPLYVSKAQYGLVHPPTNVYYRVYRNARTGEYGVFLLFEWPEQAIPPHKYDYEPVIIIADRNFNVREVYTDGYHYYIERYTAPPFYSGLPHLKITAPWRSMEFKWSNPGDNDVMIYPVDENEGKLGPRPIYLSDRILAKLRSRETNPLSIHERFIRNPFSVREKGARHWSTFTEPRLDDLLRDIAKNYGIPTRLELLIARIKSFLRTLVDKATAMLSGAKHAVKEELAELLEN